MLKYVLVKTLRHFGCTSVVIAAHKMLELVITRGGRKVCISCHLLCEFTSLKQVHENFVKRI